MLIIDPNGKYVLTIDIERYIVYENNKGLWTSEDIDRFNNEYITKILPLFKCREWFKCTDLREYELSNVSDEINQHVSFCVNNGLYGAIIVLDNEDVEMQMNLSVIYSGMKFSPIAFNNMEEAKEWLNSHWI